MEFLGATRLARTEKESFGISFTLSRFRFTRFTCLPCPVWFLYRRFESGFVDFWRSCFTCFTRFFHSSVFPLPPPYFPFSLFLSISLWISTTRDTMRQKERINDTVSWRAWMPGKLESRLFDFPSRDVLRLYSLRSFYKPLMGPFFSPRWIGKIDY